MDVELELRKKNEKGSVNILNEGIGKEIKKMRRQRKEQGRPVQIQARDCCTSSFLP
jgi:hypothetical protein